MDLSEGHLDKTVPKCCKYFSLDRNLKRKRLLCHATGTSVNLAVSYFTWQLKCWNPVKMKTNRTTMFLRPVKAKGKKIIPVRGDLKGLLHFHWAAQGWAHVCGGEELYRRPKGKGIASCLLCFPRRGSSSKPSAHQGGTSQGRGSSLPFCLSSSPELSTVTH